MKIYLSGKITGLPQQEAREKFADGQALLEEIGLEAVNPMEKGLSNELSWEQHMVKDIELLFSCDAIFMMDNWIDSKGAQIEYDIANRLGMEIYFESKIRHENKDVLRIQNAIHEVTGMKFTEYVTKSRKRDGFYARMLFVYHCRRNKMKLTQIAQYVHRDHSSMLHLLNKYEDDFKYNPQFRDLATRVNNILNKTSE